MAIHDYVIANQGFPAFRSDLNDVLQAIVSNNSNATAPTTTYAYQMWYETDTNNWYMRNADNDAWITLATFDQVADTVNFIDSSSTHDVKVSSNDTTAGFLNGKLVAGTAITFLENNDGGNETLTINATDPTALAIALG